MELASFVFAKSVSKRILETFSNEHIFKESIPVYEEVLKKSGFHQKLEYVREQVDKNSKEEKRRWKRKIIWFNPPYSNNLKGNVRKQFLKLFRWYFPKAYKFDKIFNKNTLKVSYSCIEKYEFHLDKPQQKAFSRE